MIIQIPVTQIPQLWETIKYASIKADEIKKDDIQDYLMTLLQDLLSDRSQCFIRLNEARKITLLAITHIEVEKLYKKRRLFFQCVYSFELSSIETWQEDINILRRFALDNSCEDIYYQSHNSKIWEITEEVGFKEDFRTYSIKV